MSEGKPKSAREIKHVVILGELKRLDDVVDELSDLVDRLETGNIPEKAKPDTAADYSLVQFLDTASDRISAASSQLRDIKSKLNSMLF